ncbi:hypothetical protein [Rheinheimera faecalis]
MHFNRQQDAPLDEVDGVGIAIMQNLRGQNHVAIIFKEIEDETSIKLMHVGSHKGEFISEVEAYYLWADVHCVHPIRKQALIASIQQIAEVNKDTKIRYGFSHGVFCYDQLTGRLNSNYDQTIGFTCATFVIEIFLSQGIQLVDWDTWPDANEEDRDFQNFIFDYLSNLKGQVTEEYLAAQSRQLGGPRFKPQEVAVATQSEPVSTWHEVQEPSKNLNLYLSQLNTQ